MAKMTREEAIAFFEDMNECTYGNLEAVDMAISALSEELSEDGTLTVHVSDGSKVKRVFVMGDNIFGGLYYPDSAKTDTAKPEEGAELIDRRQIKWYGCDHEGHIKGINCDTADCSKCFFATVEHDEVMSLPVYRIPDSAEDNTMEWIEHKSKKGTTLAVTCSKCLKPTKQGIKYPFCPHCGRKAVSE